MGSAVLVPMFCAVCNSGDVTAVTELIEAKADINEQDDDGLTPLHQALIGDPTEREPHFEVIRALVEAKADVNPVTKASPPLLFPLDKGYVPGASLIVGVGWCPEVARYLIEHGADPNALGEEEVNERKRLGWADCPCSGIRC